MIDAEMDGLVATSLSAVPVHPVNELWRHEVILAVCCPIVKHLARQISGRKQLGLLSVRILAGPLLSRCCHKFVRPIYWRVHAA